MSSELEEQAEYLCKEVKPQMDALRKRADDAEDLMDKSVYPFPTYEQMLYRHHF